LIVPLGVAPESAADATTDADTGIQAAPVSAKARRANAGIYIGLTTADGDDNQAYSENSDNHVDCFDLH
jgi:hypothetical protein